MRIVVLYIVMNCCLMSNSLAIDCNNAQTQGEINQCTVDAYKAADKELNEVYQHVQQRTDIKQRDMLKDAQKLWIKYRDSDCDFQSFKLLTSTSAVLAKYLCLTNKTESRTKEFKSMLECPEGDVTCPLY